MYLPESNVVDNGISIFFCEICKRGFTVVERLKYHMEKTHGKVSNDETEEIGIDNTIDSKSSILLNFSV